MKYIRTKDGIFEIEEVRYNEDIGMNQYFYKSGHINSHEIEKEANTIEKLCDEFVVVANYGIGEGANPGIIDKENIHKFLYSLGEWTIYGAIWTNKGLIYVAKMNYKGESELI